MLTQHMVNEAKKPFTGASETAVRMMLRYPWFMVLYYSMALYEVRWPKSRNWHQTLGTNGVSMWVDPDFWAQLSRDEKLTAVAHELGHKMLMHSTRRGDRNPVIWNIAGDYIINLMLVESGFSPLDGLKINGEPWSWFYDKRFENMTTEQVYDIIAQEYQEQADKGAAGDEDGDAQGEDGDADGDGAQGKSRVGDRPGKGKKSTAGGVANKDLGQSRDLVDFGETPEGEKDEGDGRAQETPSDFEQRVRKELKQVEQMARMAGNVPAWLKRSMDNADHVKVKWYEVLEQFIKSLSKADYSWSRFCKKTLVKTGCIAPDMYQPAMGGITVYVDCSGSCWGVLPKFNMHFKDIVEQVKPAWVVVKYFQTAVMEGETERFERNEPEAVLHPTGGGGTSFAWLKQDLADMEEQPEVAIVLTDMCGDFGPAPDLVPVIWASVSAVEEAPFGQVVNVN